MSENDYMSLKEVASRLLVSKRTARRYVSNGTIPPECYVITPTNRTRFYRDRMEKWLKTYEEKR